jgi:hypothetical protein
VWMRRAEAAAGCKRNEDEANRSGDSDGSRLWTRAKAQTPTVEDASAEGPIAGLRRSECVREREGREAESTHHLLRRYRRRLFLILPGPIWGMRQRHVDSESALEVEGCRERWSERAGRRGLGVKCSSAGLQFHAQQQRPGQRA